MARRIESRDRHAPVIGSPQIDWGNLPPQLSAELLGMFRVEALKISDGGLSGRSFTAQESAANNWGSKLTGLFSAERSLNQCIADLGKHPLEASNIEKNFQGSFVNFMGKVNEQKDATAQRDEGAFEISLLSALMDLEFKCQVDLHIRLANDYGQSDSGAGSLQKARTAKDRLLRMRKLEEILELSQTAGLTPPRAQSVTFWQAKLKEEAQELSGEVPPYYSDAQTLAILQREFGRYGKMCSAANLMIHDSDFINQTFLPAEMSKPVLPAFKKLVEAEREFVKAYTGFGSNLEVILVELRRHLDGSSGSIAEGDDRGEYAVDVSAGGDISQILITATSRGNSFYPIFTSDRRFVVLNSSQKGLQFDSQDKLVLGNDGLPKITTERVLFARGPRGLQEVTILNFDKMIN